MNARRWVPRQMCHASRHVKGGDSRIFRVFCCREGPKPSQLTAHIAMSQVRRVVRAISRVSRARPTALLPRMAKRGLASGISAGKESILPKVVDEGVLGRFRGVSTQALVDALWVMGWPNAMMTGPRGIAGSNQERCVGQAVTLRFVPQRPDIAADKPAGIESPEYRAFELCDPNSVLVCASVGPWDSVGGDIKFLRLAQRRVGGLVTDGSVRDTHELKTYGFPVFAHATTSRQGPAFMQPWDVNSVVGVGGVVVRPGDIVVGDVDGVVCVPFVEHLKVLDIAEEREAIEDIIKAELINEPGSPGQYYPFRPPVARDSPLGRLLAEKRPQSPVLAP